MPVHFFLQPQNVLIRTEEQSVQCNSSHPSKCAKQRHFSLAEVSDTAISTHTRYLLDVTPCLFLFCHLQTGGAAICFISSSCRRHFTLFSFFLGDRLDDQAIVVRFPIQINDFSPRRPDQLITEIQRPGSRTDHSPITSSSIKNEWRHTSTHDYTLMACTVTTSPLFLPKSD
jgi:hypothetical protein